MSEGIGLSGYAPLTRPTMLTTESLGEIWEKTGGSNEAAG